jgi:hypothetical protein
LPDSSLAGQEHGRTIPLGNIGCLRLLLRNLPLKPYFVYRKSLL